MKKISAVLLIAVLASGLVFAGFSGSAKVGFGADFDKKEFGFIGNGTSVTVDVKFFEELGGAKSEGDIYAEINGTLYLGFSTAAEDPSQVKESGKSSPYITAKITDAKVGGENWYVSLLGAAAPKDFAKSSIDSYTTKEKGAVKSNGDPANENNWKYKKAKATSDASYNLGYDGDNTTPGIEASYADYVVGAALKGSFADDAAKPDMLGYFYTPEYELADGFTLQAGLAGFKQSAVYSGTSSTKKAIGGSLKFGYTSDSLTASVASDLGYDFVAEKFGVDVLAKVAYAPVTLELYYKNLPTSYEYFGKKQTDYRAKRYYAGANLLSAKLVTDLASFDVPVKITVTGKDLVQAQDIDAEVAVDAMEGLTLTVKGGYQFKSVDNTSDNLPEAVYTDKKEWNAGLGVSYSYDDLFTAKVAGIVKGTDVISTIGVKASVESSSIIPGATLKLDWSNADGDEVNLYKGAEYGTLMASCKIAF